MLTTVTFDPTNCEDSDRMFAVLRDRYPAVRWTQWSLRALRIRFRAALESFQL